MDRPVAHLIIVALNKSKLEDVLSWVDGEHAGLAITIQAINIIALDAHHVDRHVQSTNNAIITIGKSIFDVVEGGVNKNATVVPCTALHPNAFVHSAKLGQPAVTYGDNMLAQKSYMRHIVRPHHIANATSIKRGKRSGGRSADGG